MIFAHAPAGWLTAGWLQKYWLLAGTTSRQRWGLYVVAAIGGVFPDIDLMYFHLVSAAMSHREFPTHTVVLYLPVFLVVWGIFRWLKKPMLSAAVLCFGIGIFTHLVTDSIGGVIMWLWPFSREAYGLATIPVIAKSVFAPQLFLYSFLIEGIWLALFLWVWCPKIFRQLRPMIWKIIAIVFFVLWWSGFVSVYLHTTRIPAGVYFSDLDGDGVYNKDDLDMDGDGFWNTQDDNADEDGLFGDLLNREEVAKTALSFVGDWTDPSHGGLVQIPLRIGFLTNETVALRAYAQAGIFLREEMAVDFAKLPAGYVSSPDAADFENRTENQQTYIQHIGKLSVGEDVIFSNIRVGDIIYYVHGEPQGVVVRVNTAHNADFIQVVRAQTGQAVSLDTIPAVEFPFTISAIGSILP